MPAYQFHRLPEALDDPAPAQHVLFDDRAAIARAMSADFPQGCDLWQGPRYIGRFHRASATLRFPSSRD